MKKQDFMDYVRTVYPNAVELFWFDNCLGKELIFAPSANSDEEYSCTIGDNGFRIVEDF